MGLVIGLIARFATVTDFRVWRFVSVSLGVLIAKRIQRPFASVAAGALKRVDSGNEMAWDEHQLELEGSRYVLNR